MMSGREMVRNSSSSDFDPAECYSLEETEQWLLIAHTVIIAMIVMFSFVGNGLVLLLVAKYKQLRRRAVVVSLSVVIVDLTITVSFHLPALIATAAKEWPFGTAVCAVDGFVSIDLILIRWLMMAVLSIDRFCTVRFPFSYKKYSKRVLIILTLLAWIVPTVLQTINAVFATDVVFLQAIPRCALTCYEPICKLFFAFTFTSHFLIGSVLPTLLYLWLYRRAKTLRPSTVVLGRMTVQIASGAIVSEPVAEMETNFHELRAIVTFAIIFFASLATAIPVYLVAITRTASPETWCNLPLPVHFIVAEVFFTSAALDPIVIMRDKDFRNCLKDLFCCAERRTVSESDHNYVSRRNSRVPPPSSSSFEDANSLGNSKSLCAVPNGVPPLWNHIRAQLQLQHLPEESEEEESTEV